MKKITNKRLFTFGCSMTFYNYPTWADILGYHYELYENWGKPGQGNNFILSSVIECNKRNKFTPKDDILILWSGVDRLDFYQFTEWSVKSKTYPHNDSFSCCPDGYEFFSLIYKTSCHSYLKNLNANYKSMDYTGPPLNQKLEEMFKDEIDEIQQVNFVFNNKKTKPTNYNEYQDFLVNLYKKQAGKDWPTLNQILNGKYVVRDSYILKEIEDFKQRINFHSDWNFDKDIIDSHPLPTQHLEFVKKYFPNFEISLECADWISNIESNILDGTYKGFTPNKPKERF